MDITSWFRNICKFRVWKKAGGEVGFEIGYAWFFVAIAIIWWGLR